MINAYDENLLRYARDNLGQFLDYGVNILNVSLSGLWSRFLIQNKSSRFAKGDYNLITAMSGFELAYQVAGFDYGKVIINRKNDSVEYWLGSVLAYAQWKLNISFQLINQYVPISELYSLYNPFHQLPDDKFVEFLSTAIRVRKGKINLEIYRKEAKLSRSELSAKSGVPLRMIEHYEQRIKNINKANCEYIISLSKALFVDPEALLELEKHYIGFATGKNVYNDVKETISTPTDQLSKEKPWK